MFDHRFSPARSTAIAVMLLVPLIVGFGHSLTADLPSPIAAHATLGVSAGLA